MLPSYTNGISRVSIYFNAFKTATTPARMINTKAKMLTVAPGPAHISHRSPSAKPSV